MADPFWINIDRQLDHILAVEPNTATHVIDILQQYPDPYNTPYDGQAFFGGSGGNRQLDETLSEAGWHYAEIQASYCWMMVHPDTREQLTYIEGDVYSGNRIPVMP